MFCKYHVLFITSLYKEKLKKYTTFIYCYISTIDQSVMASIRCSALSYALSCVGKSGLVLKDKQLDAHCDYMNDVFLWVPTGYGKSFSSPSVFSIIFITILSSIYLSNTHMLSVGCVHRRKWTRWNLLSLTLWFMCHVINIAFVSTCMYLPVVSSLGSRGCNEEWCGTTTFVLFLHVKGVNLPTHYNCLRTTLNPSLGVCISSQRLHLCAYLLHAYQNIFYGSR